MSPEIRELNRNVKALLEKLNKAEEPITEQEACVLLGISLKTMQNYCSEGKLAGTYTVNVLGKRMFYKSKLIHARAN